MPQNNPINTDLTLFQEAMNGVRPLEQDKIRLEQPRIKRKRQNEGQINQQINQQSYYFSDEYSPLLPEEGAMRWCVNAEYSRELKKLRKGQYEPELLLDLHGLTQQEAKYEIGALIHECLKRRYNVCSIMHGHGKNILKKRVPQWLAQHPDIVAFHQAPRHMGGNSTLLVMLNLPRN